MVILGPKDLTRLLQKWIACRLIMNTTPPDHCSVDEHPLYRFVVLTTLLKYLSPTGGKTSETLTPPLWVNSLNLTSSRISAMHEAILELTPLLMDTLLTTEVISDLQYISNVSETTAGMVIMDYLTGSRRVDLIPIIEDEDLAPPSRSNTPEPTKSI